MSCNTCKPQNTCGCKQSSSKCGCGHHDCDCEKQGSVIRQLIDDCSKLPMNPMTVAVAVMTNSGLTVEQALDKLAKQIATAGIDLVTLKQTLMDYCNDLIAEVQLDEAEVQKVVTRFLASYDWAVLFNNKAFVAKLLELTSAGHTISLESEEVLDTEVHDKVLATVIPANIQHKAIHFISEETDLTKLADGWYVYRDMLYVWNVTQKASNYKKQTDIADVNALIDMILYDQNGSGSFDAVAKERALLMAQKVFGNRVIDIACVNAAIDEVLGTPNLIYPDKPLIYIHTKEDGTKEVYSDMTLRKDNVYTDIDNELLFYWNGYKCVYLDSTKYVNVKCIATKNSLGTTSWVSTVDVSWSKIQSWVNFGCEVVYKIRLTQGKTIKTVNAQLYAVNDNTFEAVGVTYNDVIRLTHTLKQGKDEITLEAKSLVTSSNKTDLDVKALRDYSKVVGMTADHLYTSDTVIGASFDGTTINSTTPSVAQTAIVTGMNHGVSVSATVNPQKDSTTIALNKPAVEQIIKETLSGLALNSAQQAISKY